MSNKDISRHLFQPEKHYVGARMQQGRVITDDDLNAHRRLHSEDARRTIAEIVCSKGTPNDGFRIDDVTTEGDYDFPISAGSFYLGGLRFEIGQGERLLTQKDWLQIDAVREGKLPNIPTRPDTEAIHLIYLRAWEQCVTAVEDSELIEHALGGPDTSVFVRRMRRVEVFVLPEDFQGGCAEAFNEFTSSFTAATIDANSCELRSNVRLTVGFREEPTEDPCQPQVTRGFIGAENQAIRVQLTAPDRFVWGFDNASPLYRVRVVIDPASGEFRGINFLTQPREELAQPTTEHVVEILPWSADLPNGEKVAEQTGYVTRVTRSFDPEPNAAEPDLIIADAVPQHLRDWFADHAAADDDQYFYLRVWTGGPPEDDAGHPDHAFDPSADPVPLVGTGLTLDFSQLGQPGDYWIIAARPNTPNRLVPWDLLDSATPTGPSYFFAPLALVRWTSDNAADFEPAVQDCRERLRPLCLMRGCCTVTVGDGTESFGDVNSIRDAIKLLPPSGGEVCLLPGEYEERVVIEGRQGISIHGCGQRTRLRAPQSTPSDPVVQIVDSHDITIHSLELVANEGVAIELDETASAADRNAGVGLHGITLRDLRVVARDRSAILGSGGRFIAVRNNHVQIEPLGTPLDDESQIGREPAIFLAGDDLSIEGNRVIADTSQRMIQTASGGIQIGGCSGRVEIRENVIQGGIGNGITLGSISFVPQPVANNLALLVPFFKTRKVSPLHGVSVRLDENGCPQLIALPPAPEDDVGRPMVPISDGALSEVRIVDNDISNMGASGIAVVRFFDLTPRAGGDYVTVDRLTIEANRIRHGMRLEIGELPPTLRENAAYGGIVLADGEYMVIRGNTIENNGTVFGDPICGIFILQGEGITIDNNRVLHNGRVADAETRPKPGQRGGIIIGLARARTVPAAPFGHRAIGARQDGVPAVRIHDNVVVSPEGRALRLLAVGPVSVEGNQFTTHGSHTLNRVRLPGPTRVGLSPFVLASAASISYAVRGATTNPLPAFLDPLGGAVVSIFNLGVSNEVYRQLFGFSGVGLANPSFLAARRQSDLRLFAGGNILFHDNQVVLDALDPVRTHVSSSVLLASQDDVSMVGNQCDCDMAQDFVGINALVFGWSVRVTDNRFKEGIHNCLLSAKTVGMGYNTTIGNQGTHCILDIGLRKPSVTITGTPPEHITLLLNTNFFGPDACNPYDQKRPEISASFGIFQAVSS